MNMDNYALIENKANCLIAERYGNNIPLSGHIIVSVEQNQYIVYFHKTETGWNITKYEKSI